MLKISQQDSRDYRLITLDNGLTTLLVSDSEADKAAASMNVSVGSAGDPDDLAGLAHYLEHMLFLGTDRYPEIDAYQKYINSHGGSHNAFTAPRDTNYFFDIEPDALAGALERFSRFFIAPRFNADQLESERNVVHSEYQARLRDDSRRENDALHQILNSENPTTGFSVGSRETLGDRPEGEPSLRERVIDFYENHYGAGVMNLVVIAPQPLDELEALVRDNFSEVPNRGLERETIEAPLVEKEVLPVALAVKSLKESRRVSFLFPIADPQQDYAIKPASYLANLLGHEGTGSILAVLREAGLADGLSAGVSRNDGRHAFFTIDVSLTPEGAEQLPQVQATLFEAVDQLRQQGLEDWRYAEQADIAEQEFRFQQRGSPQHTATRLAMNLAYYPARDVQYAPYRMDGFDASLIESYLDKLTPDNLIRVYRGPEVAGTDTSPWFDAPYRVERRVDWTQAQALAGLTLPESNPFIPQDLTLLDAQDEAPTQILERDGFALWHQAYAGFDSPKVEWRFSLQNPQAAASAKDAALTRLLAGWLRDSLSETFYPARLAGHGFDAYAHARGMTLSFSGWRDGQAPLIRNTIDQLINADIGDASVARVRYQLARQWRNAPQEPLYHQASRVIGELLLRPQWPRQAMLDALDGLDAEDLRDYRRRFLEDLRIEAMAVGNLNAELAREEGLMVAKRLEPSLDASRIPELEPLDVSADLPVIHPDSDRQDSLVLRYLQGPSRALDDQANLSLLGQLIATPFYTELRTRKQLGYIVQAGYQPLLEAPGVNLLVQSPSASSEEIGTHIDAFLEEFSGYLSTLDEETLAPHRQAVRDRLLQRATSLSELTNRHWQALARGDTDFDHRQRLAETVMTTSPEALRQAWQSLIQAPEVRVVFDQDDAPSDLVELSSQLQALSSGAES
ncbi:insulinase family protein [Pistricoccus aurantiacus]|nr:insulinase family protein [Pistricoccus aurantiacus]